MENNILFFFNSRPLLEIFLKFWKISQNIQRGDPWDFFIIWDFFEILKIFQNIQRGDPWDFFSGGTPPWKKKFLMHFWMNWGYKKKKKMRNGFDPPPLWKFPYFFLNPSLNMFLSLELFSNIRNTRPPAGNDAQTIEHGWQSLGDQRHGRHEHCKLEAVVSQAGASTRVIWTQCKILSRHIQFNTYTNGTQIWSCHL